MIIINFILIILLFIYKPIYWYYFIFLIILCPILDMISFFIELPSDVKTIYNIIKSINNIIYIALSKLYYINNCLIFIKKKQDTALNNICNFIILKLMFKVNTLKNKKIDITNSKKNKINKNFLHKIKKLSKNDSDYISD